MLLGTGVGCSLLANKTPTPAANLSPAELALSAVTTGRAVLPHPVRLARTDPTPLAYTHTWATLVRAVEPAGACEPVIEVHTISWLPAKLDIDALSHRIEPGANVDLHSTIRNSLRTRQTIAMWGPYEVWHGFAHRFLAQKAFLESGAVGYQCIDNVGEAGRTGRVATAFTPSRTWTRSTRAGAIRWLCTASRPPPTWSAG